MGQLLSMILNGINVLPDGLNVVKSGGFISVIKDGVLLFRETEQNFFNIATDLERNILGGLATTAQIGELGIQDVSTKIILSIDSIFKDVIGSVNNTVNRVSDLIFFSIIMFSIPATALLVFFGPVIFTTVSNIITGLLGNAEFRIKL